MFDNQARTLKNKLLMPAVRVFGIFTPTQISVMGKMFVMMSVYFLLTQQYGLALIFWIINRIFDGMDGLVARQYGKQSDVGGYIDIICDFLAYASIPIAWVFGNPSPANWAALAILQGTFYINSASWMYLSAILEKRNMGAAARGETTSVSIPGGIVGGFLTIVYYCLFMLLPQYILFWFYSMSFLVAIGILQRMWWANVHLSAEK